MESCEEKIGEKNMYFLVGLSVAVIVLNGCKIFIFTSLLNTLTSHKGHLLEMFKHIYHLICSESPSQQKTKIEQIEV